MFTPLALDSSVRVARVECYNDTRLITQIPTPVFGRHTAAFLLLYVPEAPVCNGHVL